MKRSLIFAFLSISLVGCASSTFEWKNDEGDTFYIEKEDVTCHTDHIESGRRNIAPNGYNMTWCKANGYSIDLAGEKQRYAGGNRKCKQDEYEYVADFSNKVFISEEISGRNPNHVNCAAALHFGKYNPI